MSPPTRIRADDFFRAEPPDDGAALEGAELRRAFWRVKGREREITRERAFWASTNEAVAAAYEQLELKSAEVTEAREALLRLNRELEERVEEQVVEIVRRAADVDALNVQLRVQVQERSRELAAALARLSTQGEAAIGPGVEVGGRVRIVRAIGSGGMGAAYLGNDLLTGRPVAVKVMHAGGGADAVRRFVAEAAAAASVAHPGIARTLHVDVGADGRVYQIMEYVEGVTLAARLARGALGAGPSAFVGAAVADALAAAHALGVIHRDIKPNNLILCRAPPGVRILDFGISKILGAQADPDGATRLALTQTGQILGTPEYMSPEQIVDPSAVTAASDVYSLGVVLYEMLAGAPPFAPSSVGALLVAHMREPPRDVRLAASGVPDALADLVNRCLGKDPPARPRAAELSVALERIARALGAPPVETLADEDAAARDAPTAG